MLPREEYQGIMTEKFGLWRVRFDALCAKVNQARPEVKQLIEDQRQAAARARQKLEELKVATEEKYDAVKLEFRRAWRGVVESLKSAERVERARARRSAGAASDPTRLA